ncbi:SLAC1 family transporter [Streptomyces sp. NPDC001970]
MTTDIGATAGAPRKWAVALMTVGFGTHSPAKDWIGLSTALRVDLVLWVAGTPLSLVTSVWIPFLAIADHEAGKDPAFAGWLMHVIPPMLSPPAVRHSFRTPLPDRRVSPCC